MMKTRISIALLLFCGSAWAANSPLVNSQGTAGAPVSVTTTTKVLAGNTNRKWWCIVPETVAVRCEWGTSADGAPGTTPTSSVGFYISAGTYFCQSQTPGGSTWYLNSVQNRLDCASTAGAVSVSSEEEP